MDKLIINLKEQFQKMCATGKLFRADISGREVYQFYLMAFPDGSNPTFRSPESSTHNCNNCNNFIKRYGNIVAVNEKGELMTLFGDLPIEGAHKVVADTLDKLLKTRKIENVFFETWDELNSLNYEKCKKDNPTFRLGIAVNHKTYTTEEANMFGVVTAGEVYTFNHLHVDLPKKFVDMSGNTVENIMAHYRDKHNVFKRGLEEIPMEVLMTVKDLINQGSLLNGNSYLHFINSAITHKKAYDALTGPKENWIWQTSYSLDEATAKFKNNLIGTFCEELASGVDLNVAWQNWNKRADPANYMKASAPITKGQIEAAQKFVTENGYIESFDRRLATIDDIQVSDIKHIATSDKVKAPVTIFANVKPTAAVNTKAQSFDGVEEVSIEKFMTEILPSCSSVEVMLQNRHEGNLVTMTTTKSSTSKPIFKWPNNYSWDYKGNLAGKSMIKEAVKTKGGKVDGVLRFSIMWAEGDATDNSDLDAWCRQPDGIEIGYSVNRYPSKSNMTGSLDVDIREPHSYRNTNIVENITFADKSKMKNGTFKFWVNQFASRGSKGFKAEIEFDGTIYSYEYNRPVSGNVHVAEVTLNNGQFTIKHLLPSNESSKTVWGMETNTFQKVNLICLSPNHWQEPGVGNKHYFFMLENAVNNEDVRGFHNENLLPELLDHRKVMEVLGANNKIPSSEPQLSGLGFNSTVRDSVILKITGTFNRTIKVKF